MGNGTHILAISQTSTVSRDREHHIRWWHLLAPTLYQGIAWPFVRLLLQVVLRPKVNGLENLEIAHRIRAREGIGVLFVMNHSNALDFVFPFLGVTPISTLFPLFFIARKSSLYHENKSLGWWKYLLSDGLLSVSGAHPHYSGFKDYSKSLPLHVELLKSGASVCIFPEGKIRRVNKDYVVHGGVGFLAEKTRALIVPVRITGVEHMTSRQFFTRKRTATVTYGTPLRPDDVLGHDDPVPERYQKAAARILDKIYALD